MNSKFVYKQTIVAWLYKTNINYFVWFISKEEMENDWKREKWIRLENKNCDVEWVVKWDDKINKVAFECVK